MSLTEFKARLNRMSKNLKELKNTAERIFRGVLPDEALDQWMDSLDRSDAHLRLVESLEKDFAIVLQELQVNRSDQLRRRTAIRTLFAYIEGTLFVLKQQVLEQCESKRIELGPEEYALLREWSYDLKDNGEPRLSDKFLRLAANMRFTFRVYAQKLGNAKFEIDTNDSGWKDLIEAIEIRNNLMHPKSITDLQINNAQLQRVLSAARWYRSTVNKLSKLVAAANQQRRNATRAHIEAMIESVSHAQKD